jgi:hypothetical protein
MKENPCHTPRRCQRFPSKIPISLIVEDAPVKADNSALAVDISPRGARVHTKLALAPGEWVKVVAKEDCTQAEALVVWAREDEFNHSTSAGLELFYNA